MPQGPGAHPVEGLAAVKQHPHTHPVAALVFSLLIGLVQPPGAREIGAPAAGQSPPQAKLHGLPRHRIGLPVVGHPALHRRTHRIGNGRRLPRPEMVQVVGEGNGFRQGTQQEKVVSPRQKSPCRCVPVPPGDRAAGSVAQQHRQIEHVGQIYLSGTLGHGRRSNAKLLLLN